MPSLTTVSLSEDAFVYYYDKSITRGESTR